MGNNNIHISSKIHVSPEPSTAAVASFAESTEEAPPDITPITGEEATTEKMFGPKGGYFHPYGSLQGEWTDNLFNINFDQTGDFITTATGGIWYSLPRLDEVPISYSVHNSAIGGLRLPPRDGDSFERYQTYILGETGYRTYADHSDLNYLFWRLEGLYQQNLPAGISFRFLDRFTRDQDNYDIGSFLPQDFTIEGQDVVLRRSPSLIRSYYSNLADLSVFIDMSGKFESRLQMTNFFLDYKNAENDWLDRTDTRFSVSLRYKYSPKTIFFIESDYVVVDYETDSMSNSDSSFYVAGINWKKSEKTSLSAKGGYQTRQYNTGTVEDQDTFTTQITFNYALTDKTKISFDLYKALEESNSLANSGMDTTVANLHYEQRFNYRFLGSADISYEKNNYERFTSTANSDSIEKREDTGFSVKTALQYTFRDWLMGNLAYIFNNRNSNDNFYDYTSHTVAFSLNIAF